MLRVTLNSSPLFLVALFALLLPAEPTGFFVFFLIGIVSEGLDEACEVRSLPTSAADDIKLPVKSFGVGSFFGIFCFEVEPCDLTGAICTEEPL